MSKSDWRNIGVTVLLAGLSYFVGGPLAATLAVIVGGAIVVVAHMQKEEVGEPFQSIRLVLPPIVTAITAGTALGPMPNIIVTSFEARPVRFISDPPNTIRWHALHLFLKNDAPTSGIKVSAALSFSRLESDGKNTHLFDVNQGRWADGKYETPTTPKAEITVADFAPGQTRDLDIALKYPEDDDCYAVNDDSYNAPDWRLEQHKLSGSNFFAHLRLRGVGVDRSWTLEFDNHGKGHGFSNLKWRNED